MPLLDWIMLFAKVLALYEDVDFSEKSTGELSKLLSQAKSISDTAAIVDRLAQKNDGTFQEGK